MPDPKALIGNRIEFQVRLYYWGRLEFEREIKEDFPCLNAFDTGPLWQAREFCRQLSSADRPTFVSSCLKHMYPDVVEELGEPLTAEETELHSKSYAFWRMHELYRWLEYENNVDRLPAIMIRNYEQEARHFFDEGWFRDVRKLRCQLNEKFESIPRAKEGQLRLRVIQREKTQRATKAKIRRTLLRKFKERFGKDCIGLFAAGSDPDLEFEMKCCGWTLRTSFNFEGRLHQFEYSHSIVSDTRPHPQLSPATLGNAISLGSWLGITGQTDWDHVLDEEVDRVCDSAMELCQRFFNAGPNLLKNLQP
jgi:hypothetical protein